jgi:hypothetical protein
LITKKPIDYHPVLLTHQSSHIARMLVLSIAVVSLVVVLTGAAIMWFVYVRRNDPDR